jgi:hypothetical protein
MPRRAKAPSATVGREQRCAKISDKTMLRPIRSHSISIREISLTARPMGFVRAMSSKAVTTGAARNGDGPVPVLTY